MKYLQTLRYRFGKLALTLVLIFCTYSAPTAHANAFSDFLDGAVGITKSLASGIETGTTAINKFVGIAPLTEVEAETVKKVPAVPNGGILAGPPDSARGLSYVRDVLLPNLTNWMVSLVLAGSVVVLVAAGIMFTVANGNQEMRDKARETVVWGIIGTVITILAYAIVRIVITINYLG